MLKITKRNGYNIYTKDSEVDYIAILDAYLSEKCESIPLGSGNIDRTVSLVSYNKINYIIKRDREIDTRFEKKISNFLSGPFYSNLIKILATKNKNVNYPWQDLYLVMEKVTFRQVRDVYAIFEYVEGTPLSDIEDREKYIPEIASVISVLHKNGLASNDIHWGNFIRQENNALKIIDLSCKGNINICQANDILAMKNKYSFEMKSSGMIFNLISLKEKMRKLSREMRKRNKK